VYRKGNGNPRLVARKIVVRSVKSEQFARFRASFSAERPTVNERAPSEDKSDESRGRAALSALRENSVRRFQCSVKSRR
jgi:hypothetical protein